MNLTRRETLGYGAAAVAVASMPAVAFAESNGHEQAIAEFTGGAAVTDGGVTITAPEIAENGNTVPIGVSAEGATAILLVSTGNPNPGVATFTFGALAAESSAATRIRLAKTQDLIAVAKLADGSFVGGSTNVKVTIGGCGG